MLMKLTMNQKFYNWVSSQDPDTTYNYGSIVSCACGRFAQEVLGIKLGTPEWAEIWQKVFFADNSPLALNSIARGPNDLIERPEWNYAELRPSWTYGQLRKRLEEVLPECVV